MKRPRHLLLLAALVVAAVSRLSADGSASLKGDPSHPAAAAWVRTELYFGIGLADPAPGAAGRITEADWRQFLDSEVTPRFPDGLTVFDAYGQWQNRSSAKPSRLRTKVLVILHEDTPERRAALDAIRLAWKNRWHDQSVLLVTQRADVSF